MEVIVILRRHSIGSALCVYACGSLNLILAVAQVSSFGHILRSLLHMLDDICLPNFRDAFPFL